MTAETTIDTKPVDLRARVYIPADSAAVLPAGVTAEDLLAIDAGLAASQSTATRRAYASALRRYETWCEGRGAATYPGHPLLIAAYIRSMADGGAAITSIDRALAALRDRHLTAGMTDPTAAEGVKRLRAGLRRTVGIAPRRQAHPLSLAELTRIVAAIDTTSLRGLRDRSLLLTGWGAGMRRSEIVALHVGDISVKPTGLDIVIRKSKSDQESAGAIVGIRRGTNPATDPVTALRTWVAGAGLAKSDPLYTPIAWSDRRPLLHPLSGRDVTRILVDRAEAAGLTDLAVSGHSLRSGFATHCAEIGVPTEQIQRITRHRRPETLARYVRPAEALRDAPDLGL